MTPEEITALRQSAANIIAHQKQLETQRANLEQELAKVNDGVGQAKAVADSSRANGDEDQATRFEETIEMLNDKATEINTEIAAIDGELLEARQASDDAASIASDSAIEMRELTRDGERASAAVEATAAAAGGDGAGSLEQAFEQDVMNAEASARLASIRAEMGLEPEDGESQDGELDDADDTSAESN